MKQVGQRIKGLLYSHFFAQPLLVFLGSCKTSTASCQQIGIAFLQHDAHTCAWLLVTLQISVCCHLLPSTSVFMLQSLLCTCLRLKQFDTCACPCTNLSIVLWQHSLTGLCRACLRSCNVLLQVTKMPLSPGVLCNSFYKMTQANSFATWTLRTLSLTRALMASNRSVSLFKTTPAGTRIPQRTVVPHSRLRLWLASSPCGLMYSSVLMTFKRCPAWW